MGFFSGDSEPPAKATDVGDNRGPTDVGIMSGMFVASPQAVAEWNIETGVTPPEWPAVEFKQIATAELGTLESILTGGALDDIDQAELYEVAREGEEGPWISRMRTPLVDALASLDDSRLRAVAAAWADTEEFNLLWSHEPSEENIQDLTSLLIEIRSLAQVAKERGEPMFVMMAL